MRTGNAFTNTKLVFFVLFLVLFVGFAIRDIRAGDVSSPLIFLGFLVVIAAVFKPWRTGSDEGTKPKKKPPTDGGGLSGGQDVRKPPSSYLLAPLLMQDSAVGTPMLEGSLATTVLWVVIAGIAFGVLVWWYLRLRRGGRR